MKKIRKLFENPVGYCLDSGHKPLRAIGEILSDIQIKKARRIYHANREKGITVIMTAYNSGKYIERSIKSVQEQTHEKWELIIVDDNSTDNTWTLIENYKAKDHRISAYRAKQNMGTYFCKNFALTKAKYDLVTFQDSDDESLPERLQIQTGFLLQRGRVAVCVRRRHYNSFKKPLRINGSYQSTALCTLMFRKDIVLNEVGYFDCVRFAADAEFVNRLKAVFGKKNVCFVPAPLYTAFHHEKQITSSGESAHTWKQMSDTDLYFKPSDLRQEYHQHFESFHRHIKSKITSPFIDFPPPATRSHPIKLPPGMERPLIKNNKDFGIRYFSDL